ncbi:unnamed protein product, partial [Mesorhabditis spiculigera]
MVAPTFATPKAEQTASNCEPEPRTLCSIGGDCLRHLVLYGFLAIVIALAFAYYATRSLALLGVIGFLVIGFCLSIPALIRFFIATEGRPVVVRMETRQRDSSKPYPVYTIPSEFIV